MSKKIHVNGETQEELYAFLKQCCPSPRVKFYKKENLFYHPLNERDIRWNFEKFLIMPASGLPYTRYNPKTPPEDIVRDIEYLRSVFYPNYQSPATIGETEMPTSQAEMPTSQAEMPTSQAKMSTSQAERSTSEAADCE